jgi:hypothetical protein
MATTVAAGESYAGIYVPTLVQAVVDGNEAGRKPFINIKGGRLAWVGGHSRLAATAGQPQPQPQ